MDELVKVLVIKEPEKPRDMMFPDLCPTKLLLQNIFGGDYLDESDYNQAGQKD